MKKHKFVVVVSLAGAIDVEVMAKDRDEARIKGEEMVQNMSDKEFAELLELESSGSDVISRDGVAI